MKKLTKCEERTIVQKVHTIVQKIQNYRAKDTKLSCKKYTFDSEVNNITDDSSPI